MKSKLLFGSIVAILILGDLFFGIKYNTERLARTKLENTAEIRAINSGAVEFLDAFVEKVLKSTKEVDFETRLKLENQVREIKDDAILKTWQKFTTSKTEAEAQEQVKNLLSLLAKKISGKE